MSQPQDLSRNPSPAQLGLDTKANRGARAPGAPGWRRHRVECTACALALPVLPVGLGHQWGAGSRAAIGALLSQATGQCRGGDRHREDQGPEKAGDHRAGRRMSSVLLAAAGGGHIEARLPGERPSPCWPQQQSGTVLLLLSQEQ
jgi:hypothetical protein